MIEPLYVPYEQYNNYFMYYLQYYIIYYKIFIIYYSSDSPSSLITESLSVTQSLLHTRHVSWITVKVLVTSNIIQSVCLVGKGQLKERCGLELRTDIFFVKKSTKTSAD